MQPDAADRQRRLAGLVALWIDIARQRDTAAITPAVPAGARPKPKPQAEGVPA